MLSLWGGSDWFAPTVALHVKLRLYRGEAFRIKIVQFANLAVAFMDATNGMNSFHQSLFFSLFVVANNSFFSRSISSNHDLRQNKNSFRNVRNNKHVTFFVISPFYNKIECRKANTMVFIHLLCTQRSINKMILKLIFFVNDTH